MLWLLYSLLGWPNKQTSSSSSSSSSSISEPKFCESCRNPVDFYRMSTILRPYATFALRSLIRRFIIEVPDNLDLSVFADDERDTKANSIQTVNGTFNRVQSGDHGSNGDCLVFDACAPPQLFKTGTLGIVRVGLFVMHTSDDCYRSEQMASRGNPRGLSKIIEAPRGEILQKWLGFSQS